MRPEVWAWPEGGAVPDLGAVLATKDLGALAQALEAFQDRELEGILAEQARAEAALRAQAEDLARRGVRLNLSRMLRGGLWERALDWWDDLRFGAAGGASAAPVPSDRPWALSVGLAETKATAGLSLEHEELDAEVDRMVAGLAAQIAAQRGAGIGFTVPQALQDQLEGRDDWTEAEELLDAATDIRHYWPAGQSPALALSVCQEDNGLPITVLLSAHGPAADRVFMATLARMGGV